MSTGEDVTLTIKVTMRARWIPTFLGALRRMELLGKQGSSRRVAIYADGDGDFRPRFEWDGEFAVAEPVESDVRGNTLFDAG